MRWYRLNGRHALPWRLTRDPYAILVSEVMLQQTQVERVLPYYARWLGRWPTLAALAGASPAEVIRAWRGMGYNRRALNLHRLAVHVTANHRGTLPTDMGGLQALPGIGPYTAAAIRCFARGETVPVADTNIARVLARIGGGVASQRDVPAGALRELAAQALPQRGARDHNLALMDLGALVCSARSPRCDECPVSRWCAWRGSAYPAAKSAVLPALPFEGTARYARGRIVDALRRAPATEDALRALLPEAHRAKLAAYLRSLEAEGLAVKDGHDAWALPE